MTTATGKTTCIICDKEKVTIRSGGCLQLQEFYYNHCNLHQQALNKQQVALILWIR
jgi:hypothetical protein